MSPEQRAHERLAAVLPRVVYAARKWDRDETRSEAKRRSDAGRPHRRRQADAIAVELARVKGGARRTDRHGFAFGDPVRIVGGAYAGRTGHYAGSHSGADSISGYVRVSVLIDGTRRFITRKYVEHAQ